MANFANFLLISTYALHSIMPGSTISVKNQARLAHKLVDSYSRSFTVFVKTSGTMLQNHETWDKIEF